MLPTDAATSPASEPPADKSPGLAALATLGYAALSYAGAADPTVRFVALSGWLWFAVDRSTRPWPQHLATLAFTMACARSICAMLRR